MEEQTTALSLPDEAQFKRDITAINRFQQICRANMVEGQDFGVIPGTQKPTLLKPGAEKIAKLLGLADHYEILVSTEDWGKPFFHYLVKCTLVNMRGITISEGLGECNSMESKYRFRWLWGSELPDGFDKEKAIKRWVKTKVARVPQYRIENDDIYSIVNTLLKMAKKRASVDASLSAGRLSNVFTQDIEDIDLTEPSEGGESEAEEKPTKPKGHWCSEHNCVFFKRGQMKTWAHPIKGTDPVRWCNELEEKPTPEPEMEPELEVTPSGEVTKSEVAQPEGAMPRQTGEFTTQMLYNNIALRMRWKDSTPARSWIVNKCRIEVEQIDKDPEGVWREVKALVGWD